MKTFSKHKPASVMKLVALCIGVIALVAFASFIMYEGTKVTVDLKTDDGRETVQTHANTVGDLLAELGIEVNEYDEISPALDHSLENRLEIHHQEAKQLYVVIDENKKSFYTTKNTVGEFFEEENLTFTKHDILSFEEDDLIEEGLELSVTTAFQVEINDGGEKSKVWSTGEKVSELLEGNEISLSSLDKVKPKLEQRISEDTDIKITRIEKEKKEIEEAIEFQTVRKEDSSLEKGKEKVIEEGKRGSLLKIIEIIKENGEEADRTIVEEIQQEAEDRVIAVGTKEPPPPREDLVTVSQKTDTGSSGGSSGSGSTSSSQPDDGEKTLYVEATAYTADCSGCTGITAYGIDLNKDRNAKVVAVDPSVIPLGTKVWVEGYGEAIAGDVGGAIKGNRIDLHMSSKTKAYQYGRKQNVKVVVLD